MRLWILIALDGTEYFCSQKLNCGQCLRRKCGNGAVESYHAMLAATIVAPGHNLVLPLMPEFIAPQDGAEKQDCERKEVKCWLSVHRQRVSALRPVYLGDETLWTQAREAIGARARFFRDLHTITAYLPFQNWTALLNTLRQGKAPPS